MQRVSLFVLLAILTPILSCQQSTKGSTTPKPDNGSFLENTYRNDFFGFSYQLPKDWHKRKMTPTPLPSGAYYLLIANRDTGHSLLNSLMIVADPESRYPAGLSEKEYLSGLIRAVVSQPHAEVVKEPSSCVWGGKEFYRADYKQVNNGATIYTSMVSTKRNGYWLNWQFMTPSQSDLEDAVNTLRNISFDSSPQVR